MFLHGGGGIMPGGFSSRSDDYCEITHKSIMKCIYFTVKGTELHRDLFKHYGRTYVIHI